MKSALLLLGVLAFTALAGGQTPTPTQQVQATADSIVRDGNMMHLRGHVQLRRGPTIVTADEADLPARVELSRSSATVELRGNVRLTFEDPIPLSLAPR
jgi:lipopolysaccharide export system protein LptA